MPDKQELRDRFRRLRRAIPAEARERASRDVCAKLSAMPLGDVVAVYLATADELDLSAFISDALSRGVTLLAPRWTGDGYELAQLRGLSPSDVQPGPHGVLEPRLAQPSGSVPNPLGSVPTESPGSVPTESPGSVPAQPLGSVPMNNPLGSVPTESPGSVPAQPLGSVPMKMVKTVESVAKTPKMAGATLGSVPKMAGSVPRPTAWVVPGLAFTRGGVRLGYGGGWYDRMLGVGTDPAQRIGVAYPFQVVEELPSEPHDVRLTGLVVAGEADFKEEEI